MDFFKKVSDGVSQKATDVSATMRLNSQLKSTEEELRKVLQSLGETTIPKKEPKGITQR